MISRVNHWFKRFYPFLGITLIFYALVVLTIFLFNYTGYGSKALAQHLNPLFLLINYDAGHYFNIAINGYQAGILVFFPLYPFLIRALSLFFSPIAAGFLINFLSLSVALYYLYYLIKETYDENVSKKTIILLLAFPTSLFFISIYTESLFIALLAAFFYYLKNKKWLVAACLGFFASLTRNVGIFLWPVYLIALFYNLDYFLTFHWKKRLIKFLQKREFWYSLIIPAGLLLYCLYCYFNFGDFLAFINGQAAWSDYKVTSWPGSALVGLYNFIANSNNLNNLYNFILVVFFYGGSFFLLLATTIYWFIKKHWPFATFCLLNTLLFSCISPMVSVNRYVVVIFPIFIFLVSVTRKRDWVFYSLLVLFLILLMFNIRLFTTGGWVA